MRHKIIAGNWKMNLTHREARPYLDALLAELGELNPIEVVLIPPFTAIPALAEALTKSESVKLGAQNMHWAQHGAFEKFYRPWIPVCAPFSVWVKACENAKTTEWKPP